MNSAALDSLTLRLLTGWQQAVGQRVAVGLVGAAILLLTVRALLKKDCSLLAALIWLSAGSVLLVFSFIPQQFIRFVISKEYIVRIRFIMGGVSILVLLITLESIRRTHLQERYALLWVATALVIFFCVLFPHAVDLFRAATGMTYVTAIVAVTFTFIVLVAFHFSISMSITLCKQSKIAQRVAILEARLSEVERNGDESRE